MTEIDRDVVLRRIQGLLNKTVANGCTEEEAMLAAAKARELKDAYHFTQTDLEIEQEKVVEVQWERRTAFAVTAADMAVRGIERFCHVRIWFHKLQGKRRVVGFGLKSDVALAEWFYQMIDNVIAAERHAYYRQIKNDADLSRQEKRMAVWSFGAGMGQRINERLIEMAMALEPTAKTASGTELATVKTAVVTAAYKERHALTKWGKGPRGGAIGDAAAFAGGRAAGDRVNLNRPVGHSATRVLRIK